MVEQPRILDAISFVVFPSGFIIYNIHYWFMADYNSK